MAQALGGIAEAYSTPGQPLKTGIVSVADETCAILAFGGALAALTYARATGIGQKVDCSLLGGQIRLMGWTLTTAMWRNRDPVTGQARVTGTPERPGLSASFDDRDGKPLVFQLGGGAKWRDAMTALGFYEALEKAGFGDLGVIIASDEKRADPAAHARRAVRDGAARGLGGAAARRRHRLGTDQHLARSLQRSRRPGQRLRGRNRLPEARQAAQGARLAVEFLRNPGPVSASPPSSARTTTMPSPASATPRRRSRISGKERSSEVVEPDSWRPVIFLPGFRPGRRPIWPAGRNVIHTSCVGRHPSAAPRPSATRASPSERPLRSIRRSLRS